jgi:Ribbon-helix-helix domain
MFAIRFAMLKRRFGREEDDGLKGAEGTVRGGVMKQSARWTLTVSDDVNRRVRRYLGEVGRKGDLSAFVEEAVRARLLQLSMKTVPTYSRPSANDLEAPPQETSAENLKGDGSYGG